jgi:protein-S-isoprenylcysteine O-methyltransferase Ste14
MINLKTHLVIFLIFVLLLLAAGYLVFRVIVRRDYLVHGHLTSWSSSLQLLIFAGIMCFPYLFNALDWPWFWMLSGPASPQQEILGLVVILLGFVIAFGSMAWFGIRRAFGIKSQGLVSTGPYRISRNPQILGGYLLVIGVSLQWPSWFAAIWIVLYGLFGHWMIKTEEEHLQKIFGKEYSNYCQRTPRYLLKLGKS